jgi:hypothetical protein
MGEYLNMKKALLCVLTLVVLLSISCAPQLYQVKDQPLIDLPKEEKYNVNLDSLNKYKPQPIQEQYGRYNKDGKIELISGADIKNVDVVVLTPQEYSKIDQILTLTTNYKQVIYLQEALINSRIDTTNQLKELLKLESMKSNELYKLGIERKNDLLMEKYETREERLWGYLQVLLMGGVAIAAVAL